MRRGFKIEARKLALELRAELGLDAYEQFDPYALADEYGIRVFRLGELSEDQAAREAAAHYTQGHSAVFSAALVPIGHKRFILDNDGHDPRRRRNSVSHEMSHLVLEHEFSQVLLTSDGCPAFSQDNHPPEPAKPHVSAALGCQTTRNFGLKGLRRWAPARPVSRPDRQPATGLPAARRRRRWLRLPPSPSTSSARTVRSHKMLMSEQSVNDTVLATWLTDAPDRWALTSNSSVASQFIGTLIRHYFAGTRVVHAHPG